MGESEIPGENPLKHEVSKSQHRKDCWDQGHDLLAVRLLNHMDMEFLLKDILQVKYMCSILNIQRIVLREVRHKITGKCGRENLQ